MRIVVCGSDVTLVESWEEAFANDPGVESHPRDLLDVPADA